MRQTTLKLTMMSIGLGALAACGAPPAADEPTGIATTESSLMISAGAQTWGNGKVIPICWMTAGQQPPGQASPRDWTPEHLNAATDLTLSWARVTNIRFDWSSSGCPTSGAQKFVRISLLGKTVNDSFGWDGGTTRIAGMGSLKPPVAFNAANPTLGDSVNFVFRADGQGQTSRSRARYIAVHEFGHVLGFAHEQDRNDNNGRCTNGVGADNGQFLTPYDQQSIMNYCGPNNGTLTATDVIGVRKLYGYRNAGDFNLDGRRDVLWHNRNTGVVKYWAMDGVSPTSFPPDMTGPIPTAWRLAGTGDFNSDGETDLVWQNSSTGESKLWLLNAGSPVSFPGPFATGVGAEWKIRGIGDVDGDGHPDIVWQSDVTGNGKVWLMQNGSPVGFPGPFATNIPLDWKIVGMGDFNGDGKDDVVWQNRNNGQSKVWLMGGPSSPISFPTPFATGVPPEWVITAVGDQNQDDFPDITWTNTNTGESKYWLLNGPSSPFSFPGPFATGIPSEWEIVGP